MTYIDQLKAELVDEQARLKAINRKAHAKAGMALGFGFFGCLAQWVGLGVNIYVIYDWNVIEPVTWMLCKQICVTV